MRATLTELFHVLLSFPLWVFVALAWLAVHAWRRPASRLHRWRLGLAVVAVLYYVAAMPVIANLLQTRLEHWHPVPEVRDSDRRDDNLILVLTGGWQRTTASGHEQRMGEEGYERTLVAVKLWRRVGGRLLFAGAPSPDGKDSLAARMAGLAHELGVPREALLVEPASLNTHENFLFSRRLVGDITGRVWLITSAVHMPRSALAARAAGFPVIPYPCDFRADERGTWTQFVPNGMTRGQLEHAFHEYVGILVYRLKGWG